MPKTISTQVPSLFSSAFFPYIWILPCLIGLFLVLLLTRPVDAFDTFEHRYLGNATETLVIKELRIEKHVWTQKQTESEQREGSRKNLEAQMADKFLQQVPLGFGDLAALAGDYAKSVEKLRILIEGIRDLSPKKAQWTLATRRQWLNACRWHHEHIHTTSQQSNLEHCFPQVDSLHHLEWILYQNNQQVAKLGGEGYAPAREELSEFEKLPAFVRLASNNKDHFPQHSWSNFIRHHYCALTLAALSSNAAVSVPSECDFPRNDDISSKELSDKELFDLAYLHEGFAHHFLHDSFSSGHIGVPYGKCLLWPLPLLCSPTKQLLQHTHDSFNRLGIEVVIPNPPYFLKNFKQKLTSPWTAFGDDHLLIQEATFHRAILLRIAFEALKEVYETADGRSVPTFLETCECWKSVFPIPKDANSNSYNCEESEHLNVPSKDLWNWGSALELWSPGRSPDERILDPALEGWKVMATYGMAFGKFNQLNSDGSVREFKNGADLVTVDLGYVRRAGWSPNYLGIGATIAPEYRISVYVSSGWWWAPKSRFWFVGLRGAGGMRMEEGLTQTNPDNRERAQVEFSLILEGGIEIYSPIALYIRAEPIAVVGRGFGSASQENQWSVESIFNGSGAISFGLRFDLADVL